MTTIYLATGDVLAIVRRRGEGWGLTLALEGSPPQCVAIAPLRPERVNCGTFGRGLWRSEDAGTSWRSAGEGIPHAEVMSVAVSRAERTGDHGVLWVGTEPSAVFRSEAGGPRCATFPPRRPGVFRRGPGPIMSAGSPLTRSFPSGSSRASNWAE